MVTKSTDNEVEEGVRFLRKELDRLAGMLANQNKGGEWVKDNTMTCRECGTKLEPILTWYGAMLQVLWNCSDCRSGFVKDVYFTDDPPSPFSDANPGRR